MGDPVRSPEAGEETALVKDPNTGALKAVPLSEYRKALAEGAAPGGGTSYTSVAGQAAPTEPGEAATAQAAGVGIVPHEGPEAAHLRERQREAYDTTGDKILTFVEGAVDALSVGLLHEHGDLADLRREVNEGSAFLGQLTGTALGLKIPASPLKFIGGAGEKVGEALGRSLTAGPILSRGLSEAGLGTALAGSASFGHQLSDAVIENKPFAAEAIIHDMKLGALLGGGVGVLAGGLSKVRGLKSIRDQGGLVGDDPEVRAIASRHASGAVEAMDRAVEEHAARVGMARILEDEGHFSSLGLVSERESALSEARFLRKKVGDVGAAFDSPDPAEFGRFQTALDDYQVAVGKLDGLMKARNFEALPLQKFGRLERVPGAGQSPLIHGESDLGPGEVPEMTAGAARRYESLDKAAFEALHGRPFENLPARGVAEARAELTPSSEGGMGTVPAEGEVGAAGRATPVETTNASPRRVRRAAEPAPEPGPPKFGSLAEEETYRRSLAPSELEAYDRAKMGLPPKGAPTAFERPVQEPRFGLGGGKEPTVVGGQDRGVVGANREGWSNLEIPAENYRESPYTLARKQAVPITPAAEEGNLLHGAPEQGTGYQVSRLPGGFMAPTKQLEASGQLFAEFKDRLGRDVTRARPEKVPGTLADLQRDVERQAVTDYKSGAYTKKAAEAERLGHEHPQYGPYENWNPREPLGTKGAEPNVRKWIDDWYARSKQYGPTRTPGEEASYHIGRAVDDLYTASGGRTDAVAALDLAGKYKLPAPKTALSERLQQVWLLRKVAGEAGGAAPAKAASVLSGAARRILGAAIGSKAAGVVGSAVGAVAGDYVRTAGRVAGAAGRLAVAVAEAGSKMLSPRVPGTIASAAVAANRAYQYSDAGPIHDPVKRILELRRVASSPEAVRERVGKAAGDLQATAPQVATHLADAVGHQLQMLVLKAPVIYFDKLGRPLAPSAGDLRKFLETENAVHGLEQVLKAAVDGSLTRIQAETLRDFYPAVHSALAGELLSDPDGLSALDPVRLKAVETLLGAKLTPGSDPGFVLRSQAAWAKTSAPAGPQGQPPNKPQAFKLRSQTSPTPADAAGGYGAPKE